MTDFTYGSRASAENATLAAILEMAKSTKETLREWYRRHCSRQELAMYSQHERSDFAYASEIDAELSKPFWRA